MLFQREHNAKIERAALERFTLERLRDEAIRKFCFFLYDGVVTNLLDIDAKITAAAENWRIARMPTVDRNILRQGIFELLWMGDAPPKVVINEALEIAKKFSTHESSRFINGILDRIHKELHPPA